MHACNRKKWQENGTLIAVTFDWLQGRKDMSCSNGEHSPENCNGVMQVMLPQCHGVTHSDTA